MYEIIVYHVVKNWQVSSSVYSAEPNRKSQRNILNVVQYESMYIRKKFLVEKTTFSQITFL